MNSFDLPIFNFLHASADRWFLLDWLATLFAVYAGYVMVALFLVTIMKERDRKKRAYAFAWWALAVIVSRGIITQAIHFFYARPRPDMELGIDSVFDYVGAPSFPSGHLALYATLVAPMWYLNRKWGTIYAVVVGLMGIARVYGAVHWPSDVLAGIALALAVTYGVRRLLLGKGKIGQNKEEEKET